MAENHLIKIILVMMVFILAFLYVRYLEKRTLYFPLREIDATPKDIGLNYEGVGFSTEDGVQISGWFIPAENPRATVLFCHGNGGNISHRLEKIQILNRLNLGVMIFDYRGYGMSTGSPSEEGLYLDAEAVFNYLVNEKAILPEKIIVYGESLGAAIALDLAGKHALGGVIIEGGFTSVRDMAKRILPFIPAVIYASRYDSLEKIKNIKSPKLIFHSVDDEIIPFEMGEKLFNEASEPKEFVKIQGGHNDAFLTSQEVYSEKIDSFISRIGVL